MYTLSKFYGMSCFMNFYVFNSIFLFYRKKEDTELSGNLNLLFNEKGFTAQTSGSLYGR